MTEPVQGELWSLIEPKTFALIASVHEGFVLAWPVTLPGEAAHSPAFAMLCPSLGVEVSVWPTRETGISARLLKERVAVLLSRNEVLAITDAYDRGDLSALPYPVLPGTALLRKNESLLLKPW